MVCNSLVGLGTTVGPACGHLCGRRDALNSRKYKLKRLGYDLDRIAKRVVEIYEPKEDDILSKGKQQSKVRARSLVCFGPLGNWDCR